MTDPRARDRLRLAIDPADPALADRLASVLADVDGLELVGKDDEPDALVVPAAAATAEPEPGIALRGSMLAARSRVVAGRRMTWFNDRVSYPELVVQPDAEAAGATWVQDAPVVIDHNLITSPHPRRSAAFSAAIVDGLRGK